MYSFKNDYSESACPEVLAALQSDLYIQHNGYGLDDCCDRARAVIKREIQREDADIHFLVGGTQANMTVIASTLKSHEAVLCATTGHINVHETGAVEATGHKVIGIPSEDGKLTPEQILPVLKAHTDEHMVKPAMVYISNTTEIGTQYSKKELEELYVFCQQNGLYLFLDGARLGSALTSPVNDLDMAFIASHTDVFYIGGTKNGALFGEAVILLNNDLKKDFRYAIKQRGGMLAKGFLLGIQFQVLLEDGLYYRLAKHANEAAARLREGFRECGYRFASDSKSNQTFVILPNDIAEELSKDFAFEVQREENENEIVVRFVTGFSTRMDAVESLITRLKEISK